MTAHDIVLQERVGNGTSHLDEPTLTLPRSGHRSLVLADV